MSQEVLVMSETGTEQFLCQGCGRSYRWKPELSGRKVKCKCGQVMTAPEAFAPAMVEVEEEELYSLAGETKSKPRHKQMLPEGTEHCPACNAFLVIGAKICVQCGYDLVTGKAPPKPTAVVDDGTAAFKDEPPVAPRPTKVPMQSFQTIPVKRGEAPQGDAEGDRLRKMYIRIALILVGVLIVAGSILYGLS